MTRTAGSGGHASASAGHAGGGGESGGGGGVAGGVAARGGARAGGVSRAGGPGAGGRGAAAGGLGGELAATTAGGGPAGGFALRARSRRAARAVAARTAAVSSASSRACIAFMPLRSRSTSRLSASPSLRSATQPWQTRRGALARPPCLTSASTLSVLLLSPSAGRLMVSCITVFVACRARRSAWRASSSESGTAELVASKDAIGGRRGSASFAGTTRLPREPGQAILWRNAQPFAGFARRATGSTGVSHRWLRQRPPVLDVWPWTDTRCFDRWLLGSGSRSCSRQRVGSHFEL